MDKSQRWRRPRAAWPWVRLVLLATLVLVPSGTSGLDEEQRDSLRSILTEVVIGIVSAGVVVPGS